MNLKQFRYVLVLSNEGSFSKAAAELNISQPSLSQYVRKIEEELDIELFDRSGNSVRLTDAGRAYIEAGRKILDIEHQLQGVFTDIRDSRTGSITIGVSPYRAARIMPKAVQQFKKIYPGIEIIIDEQVGRELRDRAERGEYDLCITTLPLNDKIFSYREIMKEECIIAVPCSSPLDGELKRCAVVKKDRMYPSVSLKMIDGRDFVTVNENQLMQKLLEEACEQYGISVNPIVRCVSLESEYSMVCAGVGAAFLPSGLIMEGESRASFYSVLEEIPSREIVVIKRRDCSLTKAAEAFMNILTGEMHD